MPIRLQAIRGVSLGVIIVLALGAAAWWSSRSPSPAKPAADDSVAAKSLAPNLDACSMQPTMAMGVIARAAGSTPVSIPGYRVMPLLTSQPDGTQPVPGTAGLVLVSAAGDLGPAQLAFATAKASSAVAGAGIVYLHSADPALRSCHYDLADKPAAAALAATAGNAMVAMGLVSKDALSGSSSTWAVTNDPLDAAVEIVTLGVPGKPDVRPALGAPSNIFQTQFISAFVNRTTGEVVAAGYAAW